MFVSNMTNGLVERSTVSQMTKGAISYKYLPVGNTVDRPWLQFGGRRLGLGAHGDMVLSEVKGKHKAL